MYTYEDVLDYKENCTLTKIFKNDVHTSSRLSANSGYVLDDITETGLDENGETIPGFTKIYYRSVQCRASLTDIVFVNYNAIPEEPGMDIASDDNSEVA